MQGDVGARAGPQIATRGIARGNDANIAEAVERTAEQDVRYAQRRRQRPVPGKIVDEFGVFDFEDRTPKAPPMHFPGNREGCSVGGRAIAERGDRAATERHSDRIAPVRSLRQCVRYSAPIVVERISNRYPNAHASFVPSFRQANRSPPV